MTATLTIPLTRDRIAVVDAADAAAVTAAGPWCVNIRGPRAYAQRSIYVPGRRTTEQLHTFLTGWRLVDHVNGDGLDNRRSNLRPATKQQNSANCRIDRATNTSGYKGICWIAKLGKWKAEIRVDGRKRYLGLFLDPADAARAYDAAAIDAFGEFARPNFPLGANPR